MSYRFYLLRLNLIDINNILITYILIAEMIEYEIGKVL